MKNNSSEKFLHFFLPNKCAHCKNPSLTALCSTCAQGLMLLDIGRCSGCGKLPKKCVCKKKRHYKRCISAYDFRNPSVHSLIYKLKSRGNRLVVDFLCDGMFERIQSEYSSISFDFITYVPTTPIKKFANGYDHAALLAFGLSKRLKIPCARPPIVRTRGANQKFQLGKQREENASLAFRLKKNAVICGNVLLVDDVMTSGSTLYRCAEVLKLAGAEEVYCITAANA